MRLLQFFMMFARILFIIAANFSKNTILKGNYLIDFQLNKLNVTWLAMLPSCFSDFVPLKRDQNLQTMNKNSWQSDSFIKSQI